MEFCSHTLACLSLLAAFGTVASFVLDGSSSSISNGTTGDPLSNTDDPCVDTGDIDCETADSVIQLCADIAHARQVCRLYCQLCGIRDGQWSDWSQWSSCDVTCGSGHVVRTRACTNPLPSHYGSDCSGTSSEAVNCTTLLCPVHGGWSSWGSWGSCSASCGVGTQRRDRTCTNPPPQFFGDHCFGDNNEDRLCFPVNCTVHGGWSTWGPWGSCSASCGVGTQRRDRTCTNPPPQYFGDHCVGDSLGFGLCFPGQCAADGGWSSWSNWGPCSTTCGIGLRTRQRDCNHPPPSFLAGSCKGPTSQSDVCGLPEVCPREVHTNGACCVEYLTKDPASSIDFMRKIRLCDGNGLNECHPHRGRVEINHGGRWGTICDDGWDANRNAVNVLCRSIGFVGGDNIARQPPSSSTPILLDDVVCTGHETHIDFCSHRPFGSHDCDHDEDSTVVCSL